jgi:hypothetical protein
MKWNRFRIYLILQAFVVVSVIALFRLILERRVAGLIAGCLFVATSFGILMWEIRQPKFSKRLSFWGTLIFLVGAAMPVLILRVSYWDFPIEALSFLGITGRQWHSISNYAFGAMVICYFVDSTLDQKNKYLS